MPAPHRIIEVNLRFETYALASAAESGSDGAVEAVLQGEKHLGERVSEPGHS